jgi:hypothetical protein
VFVSLLYFLPFFLKYNHFLLLASGLSPLPDGFISFIFGSIKGSSSIKIILFFSSNAIGKGSPQYLCLENTQSFK